METKQDVCIQTGNPVMKLPRLHRFFTLTSLYGLYGTIIFLQGVFSHWNSSQPAPHNDLLGWRPVWKTFLFFMFLTDLSPVDLLTASHTKLRHNAQPHWISALRSPPLAAASQWKKERNGKDGLRVPQQCVISLCGWGEAGRTAGGRAAAAMKFWCVAGSAGCRSVTPVSGGSSACEKENMVETQSRLMDKLDGGPSVDNQ